MITTKHVKEDINIFMNKPYHDSFVILCIKEENKVDKTAMLVNWEAGLDLVKEWTGLELKKEDFIEDNYTYKKEPTLEEAKKDKYFDGIKS